MQLVYLVLLVNITVHIACMEEGQSRLLKSPTTPQLSSSSSSSLSKDWVNNLDEMVNLDSPNNNNNLSLKRLCSTLILLNLPDNNYTREDLHILDLSPKKPKKSKKRSLQVPAHTLETILKTEIALKKIKHKDVASELLQDRDLKPCLMTFNVSSVGLTELPYTIKELTDLIELDLSNNKLSLLPDQIEHLSKLQRLNLATNKLTSLPSTIGKLKSLKELTITDNPHLSALPNVMIGMQALKEIYGLYFKERQKSQKSDKLDRNGLRTNKDLLKLPDNLELLPSLSNESKDEISFKKEEITKKTLK